MINRLEKLYEECGVYIDPHSTSATRKEIEFYAEQIVRECANYAFSDDQERIAMLKHFGVE